MVSLYVYKNDAGFPTKHRVYLYKTPVRLTAVFTVFSCLIPSAIDFLALVTAHF